PGRWLGCVGSDAAAVGRAMGSRGARVRAVDAGARWTVDQLRLRLGWHAEPPRHHVGDRRELLARARARRREPRVAHVRRRARARRRALGARPRGVETRAGRREGAAHPDRAPADRRRGRHVPAPGDARRGAGACDVPRRRRAQEQRRGDRAAASMGAHPGRRARVVLDAPRRARAPGRRRTERRSTRPSRGGSELRRDQHLAIRRGVVHLFAGPAVRDDRRAAVGDSGVRRSSLVRRAERGRDAGLRPASRPRRRRDRSGPGLGELGRRVEHRGRRGTARRCARCGAVARGSVGSLTGGPARAGLMALIVVIAAAVAFAATIQATMGFGFALVAVPIIAVADDPKVAVVAITAIGVPMTLWNTIRWRAHLRVGAMTTVVGASLIGMPIGALILARAPDPALTFAIGIVVLGLTAWLWRGLQLPTGPRTGIAAGIASGALGTSTGTNGPPLVIAFQATGMERDAFR